VERIKVSINSDFKDFGANGQKAELFLDKKLCGLSAGQKADDVEIVVSAEQRYLHLVAWLPSTRKT
jgi:hypothetical protein